MPSNRPEFDNLFVLFGVFHILMCLFRAIGRFLAESGGPVMLTDSGVLAPGSLRGFIECYNYNRCKRLHQMLALAFEILLFRQFMLEYENAELVQLEHQNFQFKTREEIDDVCNSSILSTYLSTLRSFSETQKAVPLVRLPNSWPCT